MNRGSLYVVGTGPARSYLTERARQLMCHADVFVGGSDALREAPAWGRRLPFAGNLESLLAQIGAHLEEGRNVCFLTSGDPGYFSALAALERAFPGEALVEPGISSTQLLCARVGMPWNELSHYSVHGRALELSPPAGRPFAVLCDPAQPPDVVARHLLDKGHRGEAAVGEALGKADERLTVSTLEEVSRGSFGSPAVLLVCPERWLCEGGSRPLLREVPACAPEASFSPPGLPDNCFQRGEGVPLSRWEVRAVLSAVARPEGRRVIWDVGAGSGGFAIELALASPFARVVAFEKDPAACRTIAANAAQLGARVEIVQGEAPGCFDLRAEEESPDLAVVGGSGGGLAPIVSALGGRLAKGGRLVVTAVTLDTLGEAGRLLQHEPWIGFDALQLSSARLDRGGIMKGMNPVTLLWSDRPDAAPQQAPNLKESE